MEIFGYNYFHRQWLNRQRGFGPLYHLEQYGRRWYDMTGDLLSKICMVIFVVIFFGSILFTIGAGFFELWKWADHLTRHPQTVPAVAQAQAYVPTADPCSLSFADCPGKKATVAGVASWLDYDVFNTCAARDWPKGTYLIVKSGGKTVLCKIRDYGPEKNIYPERIIDLNRGQFAQLANPSTGVVDVTITPI